MAVELGREQQGSTERGCARPGSPPVPRAIRLAGYASPWAGELPIGAAGASMYASYGSLRLVAVRVRRDILLHMLQTPDLAGRALDARYELHELIGEGAFGRVYRGLDRRLTRPVAVKVIKPWWAEDSSWVERFQREAQLLAAVSDPGIVQIFDIGEAEEGPYYVAELVEGESLARRLLRGPLPVAEARAAKKIPRSASCSRRGAKSRIRQSWTPLPRRQGLRYPSVTLAGIRYTTR